jgi:dUTP pyrophosphatase
MELLYSKDVSTPLMKQETSGAAGFDMRSLEDTIIESGATAMVSTGIKMAIPDGYVGMVCSRSGLAAKHSVFVLNAPGIVDSDYNGEVKIILQNLGKNPFTIKTHDRIAQIVFVRVADVAPKWVEESEIINRKSNRGQDGFGSTGVK